MTETDEKQIDIVKTIDPLLSQNFHVEMYGLDPIYKSYRKMLIGSILSQITSHVDKEVLYLTYHHLPISKIEIVGIASSLLFKIKKITFEIDDGTGMMRCELFKYKDFDFAIFRGLEVGKLITVRGTIAKLTKDDDDDNSEKKSHYILNVKSMKIESDPNIESYHQMKSILLDHTIYSRVHKFLYGYHHLPTFLEDREIKILSYPCHTDNEIKRRILYCCCYSSSYNCVATERFDDDPKSFIRDRILHLFLKSEFNRLTRADLIRNSELRFFIQTASSMAGKSTRSECQGLYSAYERNVLGSSTCQAIDSCTNAKNQLLSDTIDIIINKCLTYLIKDGILMKLILRDYQESFQLVTIDYLKSCRDQIMRNEFITSFDNGNRLTMDEISLITKECQKMIPNIPAWRIRYICTCQES